MLGQPVDLGGAGGRFEIDPADDALDEIRPAAIASMYSVSATVAAACTSTVPPIP
jgi:hypothetical protein